MRWTSQFSCHVLPSFYFLMAPLFVFYSVSRCSGFFNAALPSHLLFSNSYFGVFVLFAIKIWCASTQLLCPFSFNFFRFVISARGALYLFSLLVKGTGSVASFIRVSLSFNFFWLFPHFARHNFPRVTFINQPWHRIGITWTREGTVLLLFINQPWPNPGKLFICAPLNSRSVCGRLYPLKWEKVCQDELKTLH